MTLLAHRLAVPSATSSRISSAASAALLGKTIGLRERLAAYMRIVS